MRINHKQLAKAMAEDGRTQKYLAECVEQPPSVVCRWLKGSIPIPIKYNPRVAEAVGRTITYLTKVEK